MRVWAIFLAYIVTFLGVTPAFSADGTSQVSSLKAALQTLRSKNDLPILNARPNTSILATQDSIPNEVKEIFSQVQEIVFGRDSLISLKACNGCQAIADANSMSVYLDPDFLKTLTQEFGADSKNIVTFVIAHEISHFTYEYITISAANSLSPNGNIPLLTKSFIDFVDLAQFAMMTPEEQRAETMKYLAQAGRAHAEVDLLGLLTLKAMSIDVSLHAVKYLQSEVSRRSPEELAQTDFEVRLKTVTEAVSRGAL